MIRSFFTLIVNVLSCILVLIDIGYGQLPDRPLINKLQGSWVMNGTVMGEPVRYSAEGSWVLQDQFFSFHMKDAANPSQYEANLFIGIDTSRSEFVAHWLDSFGGAGARVVGFGPLSEDQIEIVYPYPGRPFRNLFNYDERSATWRLLIEFKKDDGTWSEFAQYRFTRK